MINPVKIKKLEILNIKNNISKIEELMGSLTELKISYDKKLTP